jgi:hypothetical protein
VEEPDEEALRAPQLRKRLFKGGELGLEGQGLDHPLSIRPGAPILSGPHYKC